MSQTSYADLIELDCKEVLELLRRVSSTTATPPFQRHFPRRGGNWAAHSYGI